MTQTECLGHFCLQFLKWLEADGPCFRIIVCSCSYRTRVIYHVLHRRCRVALIFTTLVTAELQDSSISKKCGPSNTRLDTTKFLSLGLHEGEYTKEQTSHHWSLESAHTENSILQWRADKTQHSVQMCLAEGSGHF